MAKVFPSLPPDLADGEIKTDKAITACSDDSRSGGAKNYSCMTIPLDQVDKQLPVSLDTILKQNGSAAYAVSEKDWVIARLMDAGCLNEDVRGPSSIVDGFSSKFVEELPMEFGNRSQAPVVQQQPAPVVPHLPAPVPRHQLAR